jgi:hypothetical protein
MAEIRDFTLEPEGSRLGARSLLPAEFPNLCELAPYLDEVDHDREFGLELIIAGLRDRS